ncbi:diguanylate cyclase [Gallaecimonas kandeliae]|uniref:diguanylate cyclase n=1 Tax=Gallaecimonas kandeliae TaxID=3029055 RepID=UPI002647E50D|nr:diguanylate cyclase [Gallaecimonas kandeliae]WKE63906.1 diguanylate cyclase [Gallaecimonas kandeliae]
MPFWRRFCCLALVGLLPHFCLADQAPVSGIDAQLSQAEQLRLKDPTKAQALLAELANEQAQFNQDESRRYQLLVAHQLALKGQYQEARESLESLLRDPGLDANKKMRAYYLLAQMAEIQDDFGQSVQYLLAATDLYPQLTELQPKLEYQLIISRMYSRVGDYDAALSHAKQDIALAKDAAPYWQCVAQNALAAVYAIKGDMEAAFREKQKQLSLCQGVGGPVMVSEAQDFMGRYYLEKKDTKAALAAFMSAQNGYDDAGYKDGQLGAAIGIAESFDAMGDESMANNWAKRALALLAGGDRQWQEQQLLYHLLAKLARQGGDYDAMIKYQDNYLKAAKAGLEEAKGSRMAYLQAKLNVDSQRQKIALLEKENKLLTLKDNNGRQRLWLVIQGLLGAGGLCLMLAAVLIRNNRQQRGLVKLSQTDNLTGVLTRSALLERAKLLFDEAKAKDEPLTLVVADVDEFHLLNRQYGLETGDKALKRFASCLKAQLGKRDQVGRTSGAEFLLVLPGKDKAGARELVRNCQGRGPAGDDAHLDLLLSVSFGIVEALPGCHNLEEGLHKVAQALVKAQDKGYSSVEILEKSVETS